jgi:hypothetical protein
VCDSYRTAHEVTDDPKAIRYRVGDRITEPPKIFFELCPRLIVAITNYERGGHPGGTIITVWKEFYDTLI